MSVVEILEHLKQRRVRLWLDGERLQYRAQPGAFDDTLKAQVLERKADIIAFLRAQQYQTDVAPLMPVARTTQTFPLSYAQQRLWFLSRYENKMSSYHCPAVVPLPFAVDPAVLAQALSALIARHESLRTTFTFNGKDPEQRIHPPGLVDLPVHDLSSVEAPLEKAHRWITDYVLAPFDLENGPLFRAALLRLSETEHYLVLCLHHIVTDGWSMGVLQREFAKLYLAADTGSPLQTAPLTIQYVDFALWQRRQVETRIIPEQLPYWREKLKGSPEQLDLPTDLPRPAIKNNHGCLYRTRIDGLLTAALKHLAEQSNATLFMVTLAAFKVLLARYSQQWDLSIGTPVANRFNGELAGVIGFFVNTLVLRTQPQPEQQFNDYVQDVRETCLEAYDRQELPFEVLVEQLGVRRDLSRTPLFQVMFALQNAEGSDLLARTVADSPLQPQLNFAKFDLNVSLTEADGELLVECEYATSLFTEQTIARVFRHYQNLLSAIVSAPECALADYVYMDAEERAQIDRFSRGPARNYANIPTIPTLFEAQAATHPEALALCYKDQRLTYAELNQRANQLASALTEIGVQPGSCCALFMERSVEMVIALLAVLKCGAAYLPLDPEWPPQRLAFILTDADTRLVLTQEKFTRHFADVDVRALVVDQAFLDGFHTRGVNPALSLSAESAAYALYTSGSTGVPKGVINSHSGLYNRLAWMQENFPIGPGDKVLQKTNYAFDVSVWEFLWPLIQGAVLAVAEPGGHLDPGYMARIIAAEQISIVHFVPSMFQLFLSDQRVSGPHAEPLDSLRAVFCSGETLPWSQVEQFYQLGLKAKLFNLYGPTEAAIDVAVWDCDRKPSRPQLVPIGFPITNTDIFILDSRLAPTPVGVVGEIHIGGMGLATNYLHRPSLTAERFIAHPSSEAPGSRLYKTGDLGRYLPDGSIEYVGRADLQVKISGQRIEIGEIENHLLGLPGIEQAAVVAVQQKSGERYLVAYYTASQGVKIDEQWVRDGLREFLPATMTPARFVPVEQIPLNANGKIDRAVLAALPVEPVQNNERYVEAASKLERDIQHAWSEVLELGRVGVTQNFFDLGGNSLRLVRVHQRLTDILQEEISLVTLFAYPTIRGLAHHLSQETTIQESPAVHHERIREGSRRLAQMRERRRQLAAH